MGYVMVSGSVNRVYVIVVYSNALSLSALTYVLVRLRLIGYVMRGRCVNRYVIRGNVQRVCVIVICLAHLRV